MKNYRVSLWACVDVEAHDENEAVEEAQNALINGEIKNRDYEFTAEETD